MEAFKTEQKSVQSLLSQKEGEIAKLMTDLQAVQYELATARTQAQAHPAHPVQPTYDQGQSEEQARMLASLSQAYHFPLQLSKITVDTW